MFPSTLLIEFLCLLAAIIFLKTDELAWRSFIFFMLFIVLVDGTGWGMAVFFNMKNHWLYNIQLLVETCYTFWLINKIFTRTFSSHPVFLKASVAVFFVSYLIENSLSHFLQYSSISSSLSSVLLIALCCCYFYLLLKKENETDLLKNPDFWIMAGVFLFYFSSLAANLFFQELMSINIIKNIPLRYYIFTVLNILLYGSWFIAFKCRHQQTK